MAYDQRIKEEVQMANDIVDVISQYLPLKRAGKHFKAPCPFHQEKTPSFMVNPEKQIFRCFGCGVGGDVFSFVMKYESLNFPEALRRLAERAHIQLPAFSPQQKEQSTENEGMYQAYQAAAEFYHQQFLHPEKGRRAREYFFRRGYDEAAAEEFLMGWADENWKSLFEFLSRKGFNETILLKAGLIHRSPKGPVYDAFRSRLLFPIRNLQGKVVAFGGRILTDKAEGPKYLNSPESPIFRKRRELFGLCWAKRHIHPDRPQILVTEGYFDFLRVFEQGFKHVVATLGTSLTEDHVRLLRRFAEEAVVIYDGDKAGQAAALRGLEVFLEGDMTVKLVRLPEGYDPDDYLMKFGAPAFQKMIDEAEDFFDFKLHILSQKFNRREPLGLKKIAADFLETLIKVKTPYLLDHYVKRLAGFLGVESSSLYSEIQKMREKIKPRYAEQPAPLSGRPLAAPASQDEVLMLSVLMEDLNLMRLVQGRVQVSDFQSEAVRELWTAIERAGSHGDRKTWAQWLSLVKEEDLRERLIATLDFEDVSEDREKIMADCLARALKKKRDQQLRVLQDQIAQAELRRDDIGELTRKYQELLRKPL